MEKHNKYKLKNQSSQLAVIQVISQAYHMIKK